MYGVKASITYENNEKLLINCKRAVFNKVNFETKFFDNVEVIFQDQKLRSDSLDFYSIKILQSLRITLDIKI